VARIAILIHYCAKCNEYFQSDDNVCPVCSGEVESRAVINLDELRKVMQELQTPQGIVNLLESFKDWVER